MDNEEIIYNDYLLIKKMVSPMPRKIRILSELLGQWSESWRIVGVTEEALKVFSNYDYRCPSRIGVNRAHINQDRSVTNTFLLSNDINFEEFWDYLKSNDVTVLSTSTENMTNIYSKIFEIDRNLGLFKSSGFKWKHNKKEVEFLKEIHNFKK